MSGTPFDVLVSGLRHESARQQVAAGNLANLDTPGFKAREVEFQNAFATALEHGDTEGAAALQPTVVEREGGAADATGNTVDLETEMHELRDASVRHRALTRMIELQLQRLKLAIGR